MEVTNLQLKANPVFPLVGNEVFFASSPSSMGGHIRIIANASASAIVVQGEVNFDWRVYKAP
jgi:hypothetical protein